MIGRADAEQLIAAGSFDGAAIDAGVARPTPADAAGTAAAIVATAPALEREATLRSAVLALIDELVASEEVAAVATGDASDAAAADADHDASAADADDDDAALARLARSRGSRATPRSRSSRSPNSCG